MNYVLTIICSPKRYNKQLEWIKKTIGLKHYLDLKDALLLNQADFQFDSISEMNKAIIAVEQLSLEISTVPLKVNDDGSYEIIELSRE